jgi:peptidylprolyl isomerase
MTTPSGLQYLRLIEGKGTKHPTAKSKVTVHYHGTLLNGTIFDSSTERGEPITFGLNQVIKGWTEGVQLMTEGDKTRFFIPSHLAYGNQSVGSIEAGSTLIFDVELIKIVS